MRQLTSHRCQSFRSRLRDTTLYRHSRGMRRGDWLTGGYIYSRCLMRSPRNRSALSEMPTRALAFDFEAFSNALSCFIFCETSC